MNGWLATQNLSVWNLHVLLVGEHVTHGFLGVLWFPSPPSSKSMSRYFGQVSPKWRWLRTNLLF